MVPEIWTATDRNFLILDDYLPFYAPLPPIKILKKWKKTPEDIITLHKCTINDNHMMYGFWDMKHNRQNFFYSTTKAKTQKQKLWKKEKPCGDIIILKKCTKIMIICCTVPNIWQMMDVIVIFRLGLFFALLPLPLTPPQQPKKSKFKKYEKTLDISSFYTSVPKIMIVCYTIPKIWHVTGVIVIFHFELSFSILPL